MRDDQDEPRRGKTGVPVEDAEGDRHASSTEVPEGFHVHKTIQRFLDNRRKMIETGEGIDWATAEALAFGSLLLEGHPVRLPARTCERGTFSQRHSVLIDQENEERYIPLNHIRDGQARYEVINSMLSEEAVLGFEYGYSLAEPNALTLWEAQFGDFANGAQVVFDQFISSGERKWLRMSGLVCLLPHGYEGQGPEHSSARLERFLQMCAEDNMQVANCTTPANYFHILRRQLKRDFRKPLILMTPKSLLRHKRCVSTLAEIAEGTLVPPRAVGRRAAAAATAIKLVKDDKIRRVVLCSGKVYYDLSRSARSAASTTSTCCASSSSIRSRRSRWPPSSPASRRPTWSGARKSPRTWAPGPSSSPISNGCSDGRRQGRARRAMSGRPASAATGDRPDVQASGAAAGLPRRSVRGLMAAQLAPIPRALGPERSRRSWPPKSACPPWRIRLRSHHRPLVQEAGRRVKADEPLVELETDKVTLEVNAPAAGTLGDIVAKDGETVEPRRGARLDRRGRRRRRSAGSRRRRPRLPRRLLQRRLPPLQPAPAAGCAPPRTTARPWRALPPRAASSPPASPAPARTAA